MKRLIAILISAIFTAAIFPTALPVSADNAEPEKAALLIFANGSYHNEFNTVKWGGSNIYGETSIDSGKLKITRNGNSETKQNIYFNANDWATGALAMDVNLTTTAETGTMLKAQIDIYRNKATDGEDVAEGADPYTSKQKDSNNYMSQILDLAANGNVTVAEDTSTWTRIAIPLDKSNGIWTHNGSSNMADSNRFFRSIKLTVFNNGTTNDTARIDNLAFVQTGATQVKSVVYQTADGAPIVNTNGTLQGAPGKILISAKNYGLVDDQTLEGITVKAGNTPLAITKTFDPAANTITVSLDDAPIANTIYTLSVSDVKVWGGNAVADYSETFCVADATAMTSCAFFTSMDTEMEQYITTDLANIQLTFEGPAINETTLSGFKLQKKSGGQQIAVQNTLSNGKVILSVPAGSLEDKTTYTILTDGVQNTAGDAITFQPIEFTTQNTVVFFDDTVKNGMTLGSEGPAAADFIHEINNTVSKNGTSSIQTWRSSSDDKSKFDWKFDTSAQDLTEFVENNWTFAYWMKADSYDISNNEPKAPYWHTFVLDGKWKNLPNNNYATQYMCGLDDQNWNFMAIPLKKALDGEKPETRWDKAQKIVGAPNKNITVYYDDIMLIANTRITPTSITLKDERGGILHPSPVLEDTPKTIEIPFIGGYPDKATIAEGITITDASGAMTAFSSYVDYETCIVYLTITEHLKAGTTYTIDVSGVKNFGGAGQTKSMSQTFQLPKSATYYATSNLTYYHDTQPITEGAFNQATATLRFTNQDETAHTAAIMVAFYTENKLQSISTKTILVDANTIEKEESLDLKLQEYIQLSPSACVKVFVWDTLQTLQPIPIIVQ